MDIPIFYDPMIAKLVVHAPTREEAIERMSRAIDEYQIQGIQTTLSFGKWAIHTEPFKAGQYDTKFIEKYFKPEYLVQSNPEAEKVAALLAAMIWEKEKKPAVFIDVNNGIASKWKMRNR
jgi:acetyl/propionyl-CoA carboxylase alpha subunit